MSPYPLKGMDDTYIARRASATHTDTKSVKDNSVSGARVSAGRKTFPLEPEFVYPPINPITSPPGVNAEADSFNIVVAGLARDYIGVNEIIRRQSRLANEKTLACVLMWLLTLIDNAPTTGTAMLLINRRRIIDSGADVWKMREVAESRPPEAP